MCSLFKFWKTKGAMIMVFFISLTHGKSKYSTKGRRNGLYAPKFSITPALIDFIVSSESAFFFVERVATVFERILKALDYKGCRKIS